MSIYEKLATIQSELKVPKNQFNSFGKYHYRSCEDILEAAKPLAIKNHCVLYVEDDVRHMESGENYIIAIPRLIDLETGEEVTGRGFAREEGTKKGMDASQITGTASSYARKYALNGLFCIDDLKDADTDESRNERKSRAEKQKDDQRTEQVGNQKINQTKISSLEKIFSEHPDFKGEVCQKFNLVRIEDMTEFQYKELAKMIHKGK